jgi:hypothetical protein
LHEGGPEVQAPLLFFQETDAGCILASWWRGSTGRFSIRVHIDVTNPVFIVQSRGLEHDYELALACLRGFHVDPEEPWARRRVHAKHFWLRGAAFKANLHIAFSESLEAIEAREMNGES